MKKLRENFYNEATNAYYFYGDVMGQETDNGWTATSPHASQSKLEYALNEAKLLNNVQEKET